MIRPRAHAVLALSVTLALVACGGPREVRENWQTGLPMREGKLVDGKQSGSWTYWYDNGQRQAVGTWENDKQVGAWSWWYPSGQLKQQGQYAPGGKRVGHWQHWYDNGKPASEGDYEADRQQGLWRYRSVSGAAYADGFFDRGVKSGVWRFWTEDGKPKEMRAYYDGLKVGPSELVDPAAGLPNRDDGVPKGFATAMSAADGVRWTMTRTIASDGASGDGLTIQQSADGALRSAFSVAGRGACAAWHPNGAIAVSGGTSSGRKDGQWRYWYDNGQLAIDSRWTSDRLASSTSWRADGSVWRSAASGGAPESDLPTADDAAVAATPEAFIAAADRTFLLTSGSSPAEPAAAPAITPLAPAASAPADPDRTTPFEAPAVTVRSSHAGAAAAAPVTVVASDPRQLDGPADPTAPTLSPIQALPSFWTKTEETKAASVITRYSTGSVAIDSANDGYSVDPAVPAQRADLLGKPLPQTRFLSTDGDVIDLASYAGQKPVVVVLLRGFAGQVCLYCAAQTAALCNRIDDLRKAGAEVVVVYPGPAESVPTFLQAVQTLRKDPPPLTVALDVSLLLVRALDVEDNLARPTSVVIDRAGKVRYVYVGKTIADRPSVDDLLHEVAKTMR